VIKSFKECLQEGLIRFLRFAIADDAVSLRKMLTLVRAEAEAFQNDGTYLFFPDMLLGEGVTNAAGRVATLRRAAEGSALGFEVRQMSDHLVYGPEFWGPA
jgi:hypothetical protein